MRMITKPFPTLLSWHYFGRSDKGLDLVKGLHEAGGAIIADSGAYSAMTLGASIDLDRYGAWIEEHRERFVFAASLDVIGDEEGSWRNWKRLHDNGIETVPTVHYGAPTSDLDRYAEHGVNYVGLGGLIRQWPVEAKLRWMVSMFRHAERHHPQMRFHGWAVTRLDYLDALPFYTVDSSSFGMPYRWGAAFLFDEQTAVQRRVKLDSHSMGKHGRWLREQYGVQPRDVAFSDITNRPLHIRLSMLSCQLMNEHYQRRHAVTPPPGQEARGVGPWVHYADSAMKTIRMMIELLSDEEVAGVPPLAVG